MISYEVLLKEIDYLIFDSHIDDEKSLNRLRKLNDIVFNYMKYKYLNENLNKIDLNTYRSIIDKEIIKHKERIRKLDSILDGYLPSCGSIEKDELNHKITNLEYLKNELVYTLKHYILLSGKNYHLEVDKLFNECYFSSDKNIYTKSDLDDDLIKRIGNILFDKNLFECISTAVKKSNDINKLKNENRNMELYIKYYDLIYKRNKISYSKSVLDERITELSTNEIDPLEEKLRRMQQGKILSYINSFRIKSCISKIDSISKLSNNLFDKRTKRQFAINKIDKYLSNNGLGCNDIPDYLFSVAQYESMINSNNDLIKEKELDYKNYFDSLDLNIQNILINDFDNISNYINVFGLTNNDYLCFYIMYILNSLDDIKIDDKENIDKFNSYLNDLNNLLSNYCKEKIDEINNYKMDIKKLTKKIS